METGDCNLAASKPSPHDARSSDTRDPGLAHDASAARPSSDDARHVDRFPYHQERSRLDGARRCRGLRTEAHIAGTRGNHGGGRPDQSKSPGHSAKAAVEGVSDWLHSALQLPRKTSPVRLLRVGPTASFRSGSSGAKPPPLSSPAHSAGGRWLSGFHCRTVRRISGIEFESRAQQRFGDRIARAAPEPPCRRRPADRCPPTWGWSIAQAPAPICPYRSCREKRPLTRTTGLTGTWVDGPSWRPVGQDFVQAI
jgi:hypothetical protein